MEKTVIVTTTFSDRKSAEDVSHQILKNKLAACIQLSAKITSFYWWKGNIESSDEYLLTVKTREGIYAELETFLKSIHPYDTPEIIAETVEHTEKNYLQWLINETS